MSPIQLLLTRRLLLAKQLLTETALPVTEVAFASGFSSLRRFNDAFNSATACRRRVCAGRRRTVHDAIADAADLDAAALVSSAVRLDGHARLSRGACARKASST